MRDPACAAGLMRATRAPISTGTPSTDTRAACPTCTAATSSGAIAASISSAVRSTISRMRVSTPTRSPGCTRRWETRPLIGAVNVASARDLRASSSPANAAWRLACAAASLLTELSSAVGDMKPCATSALLLASARCAISSCALAACACWSACRTRQSNSVVSCWTSTCPARTRSPSRTARVRTSPATRALTKLLCAARTLPENSIRRCRSMRRAVSRSSAGISSTRAAAAEAAWAGAPASVAALRCDCSTR